MAVTASKPKAGWSWTRYVDRGQGLRRRSGGPPGGASVDTAQHHQRAGADVDPVALLHGLPFTEAGIPGVGRSRPVGDGARPRLGPQVQVVGVEDDDPVVLPERPVDPGELVVLAVGVVVPPLAAAHLVAAQEHRHTLGQEDRGQEVALLAAAQRPDLRVVGRALGTAIPGPVVALAVVVV